MRAVVLSLMAVSAAASADPAAPNVLIVYAEDPNGQIESLAASLEAGARSVNANMRVSSDIAANYKVSYRACRHSRHLCRLFC